MTPAIESEATATTDGEENNTADTISEPTTVADGRFEN